LPTYAKPDYSTHNSTVVSTFKSSKLWTNQPTNYAAVISTISKADISTVAEAFKSTQHSAVIAAYKPSKQSTNKSSKYSTNA
jgi:hypothetical protein